MNLVPIQPFNASDAAPSQNRSRSRESDFEQILRGRDSENVAGAASTAPVAQQRQTGPNAESESSTSRADDEKGGSRTNGSRTDESPVEQSAKRTQNDRDDGQAEAASDAADSGGAAATSEAAEKSAAAQEVRPEQSVEANAQAAAAKSVSQSSVTAGRVSEAAALQTGATRPADATDADAVVRATKSDEPAKSDEAAKKSVRASASLNERDAGKGVRQTKGELQTGAAAAKTNAEPTFAVNGKSATESTGRIHVPELESTEPGIAGKQTRTATEASAVKAAGSDPAPAAAVQSAPTASAGGQAAAVDLFASINEAGARIEAIPAMSGASGGGTSTGGAGVMTAASAEPFSSEAPGVMDRALRGVQSLASRQGGTVTMRLNPPELGALRVDVQMRAGVVDANFHASNDVVRQLLNREMGTLRQALESHGLTVERLQVHLQPTASSQSSEARHSGDESAADGQSRGRFGQSGDGDESSGQDRDDSRRQPRSFDRELLDLVA